MPNTSLYVPENPLERFCSLYTELLKDRPWWRDRTLLRYCALALTTLPGEPRELATRLDVLSQGRRCAECSRKHG